MSKRFVKPAEDITELCMIMKRYGSDKCSFSHNYSSFYHRLFNSLRDSPITLLEFGMAPTDMSEANKEGTPGASILGWREYFSKGTIIGTDSNEKYIFTSDRITTHKLDQRVSSEIRDFIKNVGNVDIIIDNDVHEFDVNWIILNNCIQYLNPGGMYFIEDINPSTKMEFASKIEDFKKKYNLSDVQLIDIPNPRNHYDNTVLFIRK